MLNGFILTPFMKPITSDSLYEIVHVDDVQVSPDGSRAAFVRLSIGRAANEYVRSVWIKDLTSTGSPAQPFTTGRKDCSPRWSEDGTRLGFISSRDGEAKVFSPPDVRWRSTVRCHTPEWNQFVRMVAGWHTYRIHGRAAL